jgi:hypothetical protein
MQARQVIEADRLAAARAEKMHALDRGQLAGDQALGIMVALGDEDPHAGPRQMNELLTKEQAGPEVLPVAIEDIASQHDQVDAPFDGGRHQPQECLPGRAAQPLQRSARVLVQALQGAVDVQVGGVDELHGIGIRARRPQCATRRPLPRARLGARRALGSSRVENTCCSRTGGSGLVSGFRSPAAPMNPFVAPGFRFRCSLCRGQAADPASGPRQHVVGTVVWSAARQQPVRSVLVLPGDRIVTGPRRAAHAGGTCWRALTRSRSTSFVRCHPPGGGLWPPYKGDQGRDGLLAGAHPSRFDSTPTMVQSAGHRIHHRYPGAGSHRAAGAGPGGTGGHGGVRAALSIASSCCRPGRLQAARVAIQALASRPSFASAQAGNTQAGIRGGRMIHRATVGSTEATATLSQAHARPPADLGGGLGNANSSRLTPTRLAEALGPAAMTASRAADPTEHTGRFGTQGRRRTAVARPIPQAVSELLVRGRGRPRTGSRSWAAAGASP